MFAFTRSYCFSLDFDVDRSFLQGWKCFLSVLANRVAPSHMWSIKHFKYMASTTGKQSGFMSFHLNLNSHMWLVAIILDSIGLDLIQEENYEDKLCL